MLFQNIAVEMGLCPGSTVLAALRRQGRLLPARHCLPLSMRPRIVPMAAPGTVAWRRHPFSSTPQRVYNYEPNDQRQRVYRGVPVQPGEMPPRSSFENGHDQSGYQQGYQQGRGFPPPPPPPPLRRHGLIRRVIGSASMRAVIAFAGVGALLFYFSHMEVVPVSGRWRFNCFGEDTMRMLGEIQYEQLMETAKQQDQKFLAEYDPRTLIVKHVMGRLIPVSGMSNNEGDWEIHVIDDPATANAFVLPGGKVFVYSGIFKTARTEDALAAVLGHELAHNLANHHGERASSAVGSTILMTSAFLLTGGLAYFVLSPVIELVFNSPMSRLQESEADYIGLMLMAEACFDPREAVGFWKRMDDAMQIQPPEWISTHPSNKHRMEKIQEWMPQALEKREQSSCNGTQNFANQFKRALRQGVMISM